jgi:hypothetical protein
MEILRRLCDWIARTRYPGVLLGLGLLLALPSLWNGLQFDDFTIRAAVLGHELVKDVPTSRWEPFTFVNGDEQRTQKLIDYGRLPWWADPKCRMAFWRPLTAATHILDYSLWPKRPWLMHAQSLAWFALLIWAVAVLYRRLIGRGNAAWIAALAALLFVLDGAHALPVGWLANRNDLLAGLFGVLAIIAHDRWRRDGWRAGALAAPAALALGLLCKEAAASAGGYLLAYAVFLDRAGWRSRLTSLLPCLAMGVVWYAVYKGLGFGVTASGMYVEPTHDPFGYVLHVIRDGPILLLGQWGLPPSDLSMACSASAFHIHWLWAVVFLALVGMLLVPLVLRDALARFWTLGMLLSLLPACVAIPMDRLLMFVGLGAMGLLAQAVAGLRNGTGWAPRRAAWRRPAWVMAGLLLTIHVAVSPVLFLMMVRAIRVMGHGSSVLTRTYPRHPQLPRQTLVVVNSTSWGVDVFLTLVRDMEQSSLPQRSLCLTTSYSNASLTRTDDRTLVVRVHGGYLPPQGCWPDRCDPPRLSAVYATRLLDRMVRSQRNPLRLGQVIDLTSVTIEISKLMPDGRPAEVTFRFRVPLEDPSLCWLQVTEKGYVPFKLPTIGQTVEVQNPPWTSTARDREKEIGSR